MQAIQVSSTSQELIAKKSITTLASISTIHFVSAQYSSTKINEPVWFRSSFKLNNYAALLHFPLLVDFRLVKSCMHAPTVSYLDTCENTTLWGGTCQFEAGESSRNRTYVEERAWEEQMTESGISVMIMLSAKGNIISRLITFSFDERS